MQDRPETRPEVEQYIGRIRAALRGVPGSRVDEILLELRGHIYERLGATGNVQAVLSSFGHPEEIARQYRADAVTGSAKCASSPIVILHSLVLLRDKNIAGWIVLALTALGYALGFALGGAAFEKILSPGDVGLWYNPASRSLPRLMIDGPGPLGSNELLGWWMVPCACVASLALLYSTTRFGRWSIGRSGAAKAADIS